MHTTSGSEIETLGTLTAHRDLGSSAPRSVDCGGSPPEPHPAPGLSTAPLTSANRRMPDLVPLDPHYTRKQGEASAQEAISKPKSSR